MLVLRNLSAPERLLISRRREGIGQSKAAKRWGVTEWQYRMWESGHTAIPAWVCWRMAKLEPHESCFIKRRRAGMKRTELAEEVGVSCWWITQMERGSVPCDRLVSYWN